RKCAYFLGELISDKQNLYRGASRDRQLALRHYMEGLCLWVMLAHQRSRSLNYGFGLREMTGPRVDERKHAQGQNQPAWHFFHGKLHGITGDAQAAFMVSQVGIGER